MVFQGPYSQVKENAYLKELQAIFRKHQKEQTAVQAGANPDYKTLEVENLLNIEDL